ncbi:MAG: C25 family cysteine peptidase [Pirellulales bacterium]
MTLYSLLLAAVISATPEPSPRDVVVVCPVDLREGLAEWTQHRQSQGYRIHLTASGATPDAVRLRVRKAAAGRSLAALVLIGDAASDDGTLDPGRCVPVATVAARVNVRFGSEPEIATDAWYADLDDDGLPDVPVGRIPADSAAELAAIARRTVAYERSDDFSPWRQRIHFVAGVGGFGPVTDAGVQWAAERLIARAVPPTYRTAMTHALPDSRYYPGADFRTHALGRLNDGCLYFVYLGHGSPRGLHHQTGAAEPLLSTDNLSQVRCAATGPIALLMACHVAAFDGPTDCIAEELLRCEAGPVAVIGGTRVTMPYGMAALGAELAEQHFTRQCTTLGEMLHQAKRATLTGERSRGARAALDVTAALLSPPPAELEQQRREHVHLMQLIGDPLLQLSHPKRLELEAEAMVAAGAELYVEGTAEVSGRCTIELVGPPLSGMLDVNLEAKRSEADGTLARYLRANDPSLAAVECRASEGRFEAVLKIPATALAGTCRLRVYIEGSGQWAAGSRPVQITRASASER